MLCVLSFSLCIPVVASFICHSIWQLLQLDGAGRPWQRDKRTILWENIEFLAENPIQCLCDFFPSVNFFDLLPFAHFVYFFPFADFVWSFSTCRPVSFCTQRSTKRGLTSSASSIFTHQTLLRWVDNGVKGGDSGDGRDDCVHGDMLLCWSILMFWSWWLWWWWWWWSLMER